MVRYMSAQSSASINGMYRRFSAHLLKSKGGSIRVNRAVKKHGLENFAFVVIETTSNGKNVTEILKMVDYEGANKNILILFCLIII